MPRYVAFLRAVSPMNLKMADLKRCLENAGFKDVRTVLASGNAVFTARTAAARTLERRIEAAMTKELGRAFYTIVRPAEHLRALMESDPFSSLRTPAQAKRIVTFLREPHKGRLSLPIEVDGARILAVKGGEIFAAYTPSPRGPVFMTLIEKTFGRELTTRTWDTVRKCVAASENPDGRKGGVAAKNA
jgi:uncharacterized protein (DUF1697 family)